jgi:hypothetical protein
LDAEQSNYNEIFVGRSILKARFTYNFRDFQSLVSYYLY